MVRVRVRVRVTHRSSHGCFAPLSRADARLMDVSHEPRELVEGGGALRLNATYYLTKVIIPALARLFSLVGADLWVRRSMIRESSPSAVLGIESSAETSSDVLPSYHH